MNILFIDNNPSPNIFWEDLMPLLFPQSTQLFCTPGNWEDVLENQQLNLAILFSNTIENSLEKIAKRCLEENIPFLCVIDDYTKEEFQLLANNKVQGLIQTSATSLKEIKEIMDLILNGGFYLKAPNRRMKTI